MRKQATCPSTFCPNLTFVHAHAAPHDRLTRDENYAVAESTTLPIAWLAPDVLDTRIYSSSSDVWSFGVLLWEIETLGSRPYSGSTMSEIIAFTASGGRLEKPTPCETHTHKTPDLLYDLMVRSYILCLPCLIGLTHYTHCKIGSLLVVESK